MQIGLRYSNSYSHSYCYCNSQSKCYCHCYSYSAASGAAPAGTRGERKRVFKGRGRRAASVQVRAGITHRAGASFSDDPALSYLLIWKSLSFRQSRRKQMRTPAGYRVLTPQFRRTSPRQPGRHWHLISLGLPSTLEHCALRFLPL